VNESRSSSLDAVASLSAMTMTLPLAVDIP
jgi:hypothetical protein